jgi:hypothetical protein
MTQKTAIQRAAAALGKASGRSKSPRKLAALAASSLNGKKGGRPGWRVVNRKRVDTTTSVYVLQDTTGQAEGPVEYFALGGGEVAIYYPHVSDHATHPVPQDVRRAVARAVRRFLDKHHA